MKRNWGKCIFLLLAATSISITVPTATITVSAASKQVKSTVADEAETNESIKDAEAMDEAKNTETTEDAETKEEADETEGTEADEKTDEEAVQEEDSEAQEAETYKEKTLTITKAGFVADTFNGVSAIYRKGGNDGSNATYSCAAFVKKYYKQIYEVSVHNLFAGSTPKTYEGKKISSAKSPKVGDIAYKNGHWAIVKKVNDNQTVTLIEQNWKWGGNQCKINRTVSTSSLKYFRLAK